MAVASLGDFNGVLAANIAKVNGLVFSTGGSLLLDTYGNASAAYSVRQLRTGQTYCMRVRRDSDDAEQDIGFDGNGDLDLSALATFVGSGNNGYVRTWYDQSTAGEDAQQSTPAKQPQIYSGTSAIIENSQPALKFNSNVLSPSISAYSGSDFSLFVTGGADNTSVTMVAFITSGGSFNGYALRIESNEYRANIWRAGVRRANPAGAYTLSDQGIWSATSDISTDTLNQYLDSVQASSTGSSGGDLGEFNIGARNAAGTTSTLTGYVQEVVVFSDAKSSADRIAIETNTNTKFFVYQPTDTPSNGFLATYPNALAAYSVRRLSNTAILAFRVRRDSDDQEKNIGFDASGDLDTAAISSFCGSANGYVSRWWDQSTNNHHATQLTFGNQPQIYNGTAVITENGKPAIQTDGTNDYFDLSITQTATDYSFAYVTKRTQASGWLLDTQSGRFVLDVATEGLYYDGGFRGNDNPTTTDSKLYFLNLDSPSSGAQYINGASDQSGLSYTQKPFGGSTRMFGAYDALTRCYGGLTQELIIYPVDQDAAGNRGGIESNINTYFSIY